MTKKDSSKKDVNNAPNNTDKALEKQIEELTLGWKRTQADFENYRRRTEEERSKILDIANAKALLEITPALDNFRRAFKHLPEGESSWVTGFKAIEQQLESVLAEHGLARIQTVDETFDPGQHEAVSQIESDKPANQIVEEIESGYKYQGLVLKPAKVVVSKEKES